MFGKGDRRTRRKSAPLPLCPPQVPHDLTRARTRASRLSYDVFVPFGEKLFYEFDTHGSKTPPQTELYGQCHVPTAFSSGYEVNRILGVCVCPSSVTCVNAERLVVSTGVPPYLLTLVVLGNKCAVLFNHGLSSHEPGPLFLCYIVAALIVSWLVQRSEC
jgi:hypothetical protein